MHEPKQREFTFEHLLIGEISRHCWAAGKPLDVTVSRCDIYGYDLVMHANGQTRFVQLKTRLDLAQRPAIPFQFECRAMPKGAALVVMTVCLERRCVTGLFARRLEAGRAASIHIGQEARCASVGALLQLLFSFKPPTLSSAGFELHPLRSAV